MCWHPYINLNLIYKLFDLVELQCSEPHIKELFLLHYSQDSIGITRNTHTQTFSMARIPTLILF